MSWDYPGTSSRLEVKGWFAVELLTIGQVSARAGVAPSALRYYEQQGLGAATPPGGGAPGDPPAGVRPHGRRRPAVPADGAAPAGLRARRAERRALAQRDPRGARDAARGPPADGA